jgi:hypothetical protein
MSQLHYPYDVWLARWRQAVWFGESTGPA